KIAWIRGSLPYKEAGITNLPVRQDFEFFDSTVIARYLLQDFGYTLLQNKLDQTIPSTLLFLGRKDNAFWFTGCKKDTSVSLQLRFPEGVPLIIGQSTDLGEQTAGYALNRSFHDECRIFVDQQVASHVTCRENAPFPTS